MDGPLSRFFHVQPGEVPKILQFGLLAALLQAGLAMGLSAADSLFLARVGPASLPIIYLLTPAMMLLYIPAFAWALGRFGIDRVLDCTLGLLVVGGVAFYLALQPATAGANLPVALYYAAKLYTALWYIGLYSLTWNFIDCYFDLIDAKRLFGLLAAGSATGAIVGGTLVTLLNDAVPVPAFFLGWAGFALAAVPVVIWTRRRQAKLPDDDSPAPRETRAAGGVAGTLRLILGSRYVRMISLLLFLTLVTATICEYQYLTIFSQLADEAALADLFGKLYAFVNAFNLVITMFVFPRLVAGLGVRNTALIQPFVFIAVFALLLLTNSFPAGLAGFLAFQGVMTSIDYNNVNLLFNSLPSGQKNQIRTFIEGFAEPMATATAGMALLYLAPRLSPERLSGFGLAGAFLCLGLVFVLRFDYLQVAAAGVKKGWLDFTRPAETTLAALSPAELDFLAAQARTAPRALRFTAIEVLGFNDRPRALEALLEYLATASPADRAAARPLVASLLAANDPAIVQRCMLWLDEHPDALDAALLEEFGPRRLVPVPVATRQLQSPRPPERVAGASALWSSWQLQHSVAALQTLQELLAGDAAAIATAVRGLGRLGEPRFLPNVAACFAHPDAAVRHEALAAAHQLATRESSAIVPALAAALPYTEGEDRLLLLETLGRIGDTGALGPFFVATAAFSPHERRCAERAILQIGLRCVPTLVDVLQSPRHPLTGRSLAARALAKLAFAQLEALAPTLLDTTLRNCYVYLGHEHGLAQVPQPGPGLALLRFIQVDRRQLVLDLLLEVLALVGRLPNFESIQLALRTGSSKERGLAIEMIEPACRRDVFRRLLPLIDGRPVSAQLAFGQAAGLAPVQRVPEIVAAELATPFDLGSATALQAQFELDRETALDAMARRLAEPVSPLYTATALALLARTPGGTTNGATSLTPIDHVHRLQQHDFFTPWGLRPLEVLASQLEVRTYRAGEILSRPHEPAAGAHFILSGDVAAGTPARPVAPGQWLDESALLGATGPAEFARARSDLQTLFVPVRAVRQCAVIYPRLALDLLRRRLAA